MRLRCETLVQVLFGCWFVGGNTAMFRGSRRLEEVVDLFGLEAPGSDMSMLLGFKASLLLGS